MEYQFLHVPVDTVPALELAILFLLSAAFGEILARLGAPRLSGHVVSGILFGSHGLVARMVSKETMDGHLLSFLISVCIAAIGTAAGSELRWSLVQPRLREIATTIACLVFFTPTMGSLIFYGWAKYFGNDECVSAGTCHHLAVIGGTLLLTRSPACAIGVIRDTKAAGPLSFVALGTALSLDCTVVVLMSLLTTWVASASTFYAIGATALKILLSLGMAVGLSVVLAVIIAKVPTGGRAHAILLVQSIPFLVARLTRGVATVDPLMTAITAACLTNYQHPKAMHPHGATLLPVAVVVLFSAAGSRADFRSLLSERFPIVISLLAIRFCGLVIATRVASRLYSSVSTPALVVRYRWMCLVTQGGVSLALLSEAMEALHSNPKVPNAALLQDVAIGFITVNLCIGSAMFKYAILQCGEQDKQDSYIDSEANVVGAEIVEAETSRSQPATYPPPRVSPILGFHQELILEPTTERI